MNTPIQDMRENAIKLAELADVISGGLDTDWKYYSLDDAVNAYIKAYDLSKVMFSTNSLDSLYRAIKEFNEDKNSTDEKWKQEEESRFEEEREEVEENIY